MSSHQLCHLPSSSHPLHLFHRPFFFSSSLSSVIEKKKKKKRKKKHNVVRHSVKKRERGVKRKENTENTLCLLFYYLFFSFVFSVFSGLTPLFFPFLILSYIVLFCFIKMPFVQWRNFLLFAFCFLFFCFFPFFHF